MTIHYASIFKARLSRFPSVIRRKFYQKARYLLRNLHHSSLHAKKYDEKNDIWQARVDKDIRFYFRIQGSIYFLLNIKKHPK